MTEIDFDDDDLDANATAYAIEDTTPYFQDPDNGEMIDIGERIFEFLWRFYMGYISQPRKINLWEIYPPEVIEKMTPGQRKIELQNAIGVLDLNDDGVTRQWERHVYDTIIYFMYVEKDEEEEDYDDE